MPARETGSALKPKGSSAHWRLLRDICIAYAGAAIGAQDAMRGSDLDKAMEDGVRIAAQGLLSSTLAQD